MSFLLHDDHITLLIKAQGLTFVNISKIAVEISTDIFTHILHLSQCLDIDIDAVLHTVSSCKDFFLTMCVNAVFAVSLRGFAKLCQESGQVLFDGFRIAESSRVDGDEAVACARPCRSGCYSWMSGPLREWS